MSVSERVPGRARGTLGFVSLAVGVTGATVGYILVMLGVTLYFDMNGLGPQISGVEALTVAAVGLASLGVAYLGWRGFTDLAY